MNEWMKLCFVANDISKQRIDAYRKGQEDMQKRALESVDNQRRQWQVGYGQKQGAIYAEAVIAEIRALPIKDYSNE